MIFPMLQYDLFGIDISLIIALFVGLAFGYFLEQAGLGNSKKLAAQFYLKDLTVFKVMFTAIITCMLGLFYLEYIDYLNFGLLAFSDTYILPQIIGGIILGFGFIIGGYCPGTCVIGISIGSKDALYFFGGLFVGMILFSIAFPLLESFYISTKLESKSLYDLFKLSKGTMIFSIVLIAVIAFYISERIEASRNAE